jgi:hypothetical protein
MPLKPPFEEIDPQSLPQNQGPLRITAPPFPPSQGSASNSTASDGIDDWIAPAAVVGKAPFPDDGEPARGVLRKFNIGINDVSNGVFLPANRATQVIAGETIHSTLHTKEYYDAVDDALKSATTRQQVVTILQNIRAALQSGDFP